MFIPWWAIILVAGVLFYLVLMNAHLHKRVQKLETLVRRLEGISEEELRKQIKDRIRQYDDGG